MLAGAGGGVALRADRRQPPAGRHPRGGARARTDWSGRAAGGRRGSPRRRRCRWALVLLYNLGVAGNLRRRLRAGEPGASRLLPARPAPRPRRIAVQPDAAGCSSSPPFCSSSPSPGGTRRPGRDRGERALTLAMSAGVVLQLLLYAKTDWRAGTLLGAALHDRPPAACSSGCWCRWSPRCAASAGRASGWRSAPRSPSRPSAPSGTPARRTADLRREPAVPTTMRAAWEWRNAPFIASLRRGLAPAELLTEMRGSLDAFEMGAPSDLRGHRRPGGRRHRLGAGRPRHALAGGGR